MLQALKIRTRASQYVKIIILRLFIHTHYSGNDYFCITFFIFTDKSIKILMM